VALHQWLQFKADLLLQDPAMLLIGVAANWGPCNDSVEWLSVVSSINRRASRPSGLLAADRSEHYTRRTSVMSRPGITLCYDSLLSSCAPGAYILRLEDNDALWQCLPSHSSEASFAQSNSGKHP